CVQCIMSKAGLDLDRVLGAISALEADLRLTRTWGWCLSCLKRNRAILAVDEPRRGQTIEYDGPDRHAGLRCPKCGKPLGVDGGRAVLRHGHPYHQTCAARVPRPDG